MIEIENDMITTEASIINASEYRCRLQFYFPDVHIRLECLITWVYPIEFELQCSSANNTISIPFPTTPTCFFPFEHHIALATLTWSIPIQEYQTKCFVRTKGLVFHNKISQNSMECYVYRDMITVLSILSPVSLIMIGSIYIHEPLSLMIALFTFCIYNRNRNPTIGSDCFTFYDASIFTCVVQIGLLYLSFPSIVPILILPLLWYAIVFVFLCFFHTRWFARFNSTVC
jgi:hypothetical protein